MILILTTGNDIHAQAVHWALSQSKVDSEIVDVYALPSKALGRATIDASGATAVGWRSGISNETTRLDLASAI